MSAQQNEVSVPTEHELLLEQVEVENLLRAGANGFRDAAMRTLFEQGAGQLSSGFEASIEDMVSEQSWEHPRLIVVRCAPYVSHQLRDEYATLCNEICRLLDEWIQCGGRSAARAIVRRTLMWHSAHQLLSAGQPPTDILEVLATPSESEWPDRVDDYSQALESESPTPAAGPSRSYDAYDRPPDLQRMDNYSRLSEPVARASTRPPPLPPSSTSDDRPSLRPATPQSPKIRPTPPQLGSVNAKALHGSVAGTWMMLVLLSWTSIAWTALVTTPVGVGFVIAGASIVGAILVPTWCTVWGFAGMSRAHQRTLKEIEFKEVTADHPLAQSLQHMAHNLGVPCPRIGTMPIANAFAMGRDHQDATIAIGTPLLERLMPDELDAVIGHELGHVLSGDMRRMMLMRTFQNASVWFAAFQGAKVWMRWVLCVFAELYINSFSRKREYWADAIGAALTSKEAMIGALRAIEASPPPTSFERNNYRFMFHTAFHSHPPIEHRIAALQMETYIRRLPRL